MPTEAPPIRRARSVARPSASKLPPGPPSASLTTSTSRIRVASPTRIATGAASADAIASPSLPKADAPGVDGPAEDDQRGAGLGGDVDDAFGQRVVHQQPRLGVDPGREGGGVEFGEALAGGTGLAPRAGQEAADDAALGRGDPSRQLEGESRLGRIGEGDEDPPADALGDSLGRRDLGDGAVDQERADDDRDEDQDQRRIDHRLVEEADVEADDSRGQGRRRLRARSGPASTSPAAPSIRGSAGRCPAESALPARLARMKRPASFSVSPSTITLGSSSIPTETRKIGTKTASRRSRSGPSAAPRWGPAG